MTPSARAQARALRALADRIEREDAPVSGKLLATITDITDFEDELAQLDAWHSSLNASERAALARDIDGMRAEPHDE